MFNQSALSNASKLKLKAQEQLVNICMNRTLQLKYNQMNINNFWLITRQECPEISQKAIQIILFFSTTYLLCESAFSSLSQIKTKSRSQLKSVENELRVCLASIHRASKRFVLKNKHMYHTNTVYAIL